MIETTNNVGQNYANALYQSYDVTSYSRLLWQDPTLTGWNCRTSYRWTIQHTPSQGILRSVLPPFSELKMCLSIDSTNTKGTPSPVLRKLTSVLFLYEEFKKMYSNVDVLRNFISNLPLFGNILNVFDRFNRFTPT